MKILFWNLNRNNNSRYIVHLIEEHNIDIAVFCEYSGLDFVAVENALPNYSFSEGMCGCDKVKFLFSKSITYDVRRESSRYAMYSFKQNNQDYIIVGLHLPSNPTSDADARKDVIKDIVSDINSLEKDIDTPNTIVIGDFNASPFDSELIQKNMFNAVLFKEVILNKEVITFQNKRYMRFYNPMISIMTEENKQYGSFYHTGGISSLVWYSYDQVIVRKSLIDKLSDVYYCKSIKNTNLISRNGKTNTSISDHLPLIVEVKG